MPYRISFPLLLISIAINTASGQGWDWQGQQKEPDKQNQLKAIAPQQDSTGITPRLFDYYQNRVSPRQGSRCPCFPTCSHFTELAIQHYGLLTGMLMGFERIYFREHSGLIRGFYYFPVSVNRKTKMYDLPKANHIFTPKDWRMVDPDHFADYIDRNRPGTEPKNGRPANPWESLLPEQ